jgi:predicted RNA methylase
MLMTGCGLGRLAFQVFLQFENVQTVVGVELVPSRASVALAAVTQLALVS